MPITIDDIGDRMVDGKIVKIPDAEKQVIADEQNQAVVDTVVRQEAAKRENLIQDRMNKIVRDQAEAELRSEGKIT